MEAQLILVSTLVGALKPLVVFSAVPVMVGSSAFPPTPPKFTALTAILRTVLDRLLAVL